MKIVSCILGALFSLIATTNAFGYGTPTHTAMTANAVAQSKLTSNPSNSSIIARLGLSNLDPVRPFQPVGITGLPDQYIAIGSSTRWLRGDDVFEAEIIGNVRTALPAIPADTTITGWMMRGAIREDDNGKETPFSDEPGGVFTRVFGHFYDPVNDRGILGLGAGANDWAFKEGATSGWPLFRRTNIYNLPNAREAMWRALTGKTKNGQDAKPADTPEWYGSEDVRKGYWATTFRILGDVVHLLQDMAQPQHTRVDTHSGLGCVPGLGCAVGHDSFYEKYTTARTLQTGVFTLDEGFTDTATGPNISTNASQLTYDRYPIPQFNQFTDFFSTGSGDSANLSGRGLANYSNRSFYTAGTNIRNSVLALLNYSSPDPMGFGLNRVVIGGDALKNMNGEPLGGSMLFFLGNVSDTVTGSPAPSVKLSAYGLWDQFLENRGLTPAYTLNHYNYDDQANLLVPRAVAYSAGLINYFFRGTMEISPPEGGLYAVVDHAKFAPGGPNYPTDATKGFKGFDKIKLRLKNTTDPITPPGGSAISQTMPQGKLVAVIKFHRNTCYKDDLSGELGRFSTHIDVEARLCRSTSEEIAVSDELLAQDVPDVIAAPNGKELTFTFSGKQVPINAWDVYLQVVYRGKLGAEDDAVVVATKDISEPTYYTFFSEFGWDGAWYRILDTPPLSYYTSFEASLGQPSAPVVLKPAGESNRIYSPRFARWATLQDIAIPLNSETSCVCFPSSPIVGETMGYIAQKGSEYQGLGKVAGINTLLYLLPSRLVGAYHGAVRSPTLEDVERIPALPDDARYPVALEITGW